MTAIKPESLGYIVKCPDCLEPIKAPDTYIDRTFWLQEEFHGESTVYCSKCGKFHTIDPQFIEALKLGGS